MASPDNDPVANDRAFLSSLSQHRGRSGDISNVNPQMVTAMAAAIRDAQRQGLNVGIESGYRDPNELWNQGKRTNAAYFDHNGNSLHSYGAAMDVNGIGQPGSATAAQWYKIATSHGLYNPYFNNDPGNSEWNHYQLIPGKTPDGAMRAALASGNFNNVWASTGGGAAPATTFAGGGGSSGGGGASGSWNAPSGGGTIGTTLNRTNPFIFKLGDLESNWRPIYSQVDKDYPGQPNSRSQGFLQIDTPTWQQFAKQAGVTAPNAMSASEADQIKVASLLPASRFGPRTLAGLHKQFGDFSNTATIGQLATQFGGGAGATMNTAGGPSAGSQTGATAPAGVAGSPAGAPGSGGASQPPGALAGFQSGSPAEKSMQAAAKTLGWTGGGGGGEEKPPEPGPPPSMTPLATGGQGGPNIFAPQTYARNALAQQGFVTQPVPASAFATGGLPPLDQGPPGRPPAGYAAGPATGLPTGGVGMGTTLNSPSQLQMAMLYGWPYGSAGNAAPYPGSY